MAEAHAIAERLGYGRARAYAVPQKSLAGVTAQSSPLRLVRKRCSDPIFRAVAREGMMRDHEHPSI